MGNISDKCYTENLNPRFMFNNVLRKSCRLWDNVVKKIVQPRKPEKIRHIYIYIYIYIILITFPRQQWLHKTTPISLYTYIVWLVACRMFLSSLILWYAYSHLTLSAQFIISILPQHHISKLSTYFWSTFRNVQVSAPYQAMFKMYFIGFVL